MPKPCPQCGTKTDTNGRCAACELAARLLAEGDDTVAPTALAPPANEPFDGWDATPAELSDAARGVLDRDFPPPATEFPVPMPQPLADPLRTLAWLALLPLLAYGAFVAYLVLADDGNAPAPFLTVYGPALGVLWFGFGYWRVLPMRRPNVLYLHSFKRDKHTAAVRRDLFRAFGRRARLSGIRDPRERSSFFERFFNTFVFAIRYSTPAYLNLEAGDDWKLRLWRSLTTCRGAVLDVTELTTYVEDEVRLCYRTLGPERLLFVVKGSRSEAEWNRTLARVLQLPERTAFRLVRWDDEPDARRAFVADAKRFLSELPAAPPPLSPVGSEVARHGLALDGESESDGAPLWVKYLLAGFAFSALGAGYTALKGTSGFWVVALPVTGLALVFYVQQVGAVVAYLLGAWSARERLLTAVTLGASLFALPFLAALPAVWNLQLAVQRMTVSDRLKTLAVAMHNCVDRTDGRFPQADEGDGPRTPAVSWRVRLLPYLEDPNAQRVAREYRRNEAWDSPHNRQFVELMPKVFAHPDHRVPPGHTKFRVFVSDASVHSSPVFVRGERRTIVGVTDGTSNTILIAEAADAVPWTKPEELEYKPNGPLPRLGGYFLYGTVVAFADGSVQTLPPSLPERTLRGLITASGGEDLRD